VEPLSPELALVDEQLVRSARLELSEQSDCLAADPHGVVPLPHRVGSAATVGGGLLVVLAVGVSALLLVGHGRTSGSASPDGTTTAAENIRSSTAGLKLRWQPVRGATLYNVILWRDGVRILDLWPKEASVQLPNKRLEPGSYQWFVYPMLGDGTDRRYGRVTARGVVRV
jgi:hypothetical protein